MSRRRYIYNAFETQLASPITAGTTSIPLLTAINLRSPGVLVLDPDDVAKREFISFPTIVGSTLENVTRGLGGGVGAVAHDSGAVVRSVMMHQLVDDLFSDIEDLEAADAAHVAAPDPHPTYLTQTEGDNRYVELAGDTMTGPLLLPGDPTLGLQAATKQYVDATGFGWVEEGDLSSDPDVTCPPGSATVVKSLDLSSFPVGTKFLILPTGQISRGDTPEEFASLSVQHSTLGAIFGGSSSIYLKSFAQNTFLADVRMMQSIVWTVDTSSNIIQIVVTPANGSTPFWRGKGKFAYIQTL